MEKQSIDREIYNEIKYWSTLKPENAFIKLQKYLKTVKPKSVRSDSQNKALHVDCSLIADKLNDSGYDMKKFLKSEIDIPWTVQTVKEYIYKPILKSLYHKDSTKDLEKHGEIEKLHDVIMRELGKRPPYLEYHPFPHDPKKSKEFEENLLTGYHK